MNKLLLTIISMLIVLPVFAGGVGYINYEKVASEYQFAKSSMREIETKAAEIQQYLAKKEEEFDKLESPVQKKKLEDQVRAEMQTKESAFNDFRNKKEELVYERIHAVSEKIRLERGLDAVLDIRCVFSGGIDITDELINKLNSAKTN